MNNISYFTKVRLYKIYKKSLKNNKTLLKTKHNLNVDWVNRIWKVYTIPIDEENNVRQYGNKYTIELAKKDLIEIDKTMMQLGLIEMVGLIEFEIINDFNIKIVISYKYFDLAKRMNRKILIYSLLGIGLLSSLLFLF